MASGVPYSNSKRPRDDGVEYDPSRQRSTRRRFDSVHDTGRGRNPLIFDDAMNRVLLRLFLRTGIPLDTIAKIFEKLPGGANKKTLRITLEQALGAGPGTGIELGTLRPRPQNSCKLDDGQRRAADRYQKQIASAMSPEVNFAAISTPSSANTFSPESCNFEDFIDVDQCATVASPSSPTATQHSRVATSHLGELRPASTDADMSLSPERSSEKELFLSRLAAIVRPKQKIAVNHAGRTTTADQRSSIMTALTRDSFNIVHRSTTSEYTPYRKDENADQLSALFADLKIQRDNTGPSPEQLLSIVKASANDAAAVTHLRRVLLSIGDSHRKELLDAGDAQGVRLLHLAVAYGYVRLCSVLIDEWYVNVKVVTARGTSVYRFAKHAEREAKAYIPLYAKILLCRQFVRRGTAPPITQTHAESKRRTATVAFPGSSVDQRQRPYVSRQSLRKPPAEAQPHGHGAQHASTAPPRTFTQSTASTTSTAYTSVGDGTIEQPLPFFSQERLVHSPTTGSISSTYQAERICSHATPLWHVVDDSTGSPLRQIVSGQVTSPSPAPPPTSGCLAEYMNQPQAATGEAGHHIETFLPNTNILASFTSGVNDQYLEISNRDSGYGASLGQHASRNPSPCTPTSLHSDPTPEMPHQQQSDCRSPSAQNPGFHVSSTSGRPHVASKSVTLVCPRCNRTANTVIDIVIDGNEDEQVPFQCMRNCGPFAVRKSQLLRCGGNHQG